MKLKYNNLEDAFVLETSFSEYQANSQKIKENFRAIYENGKFVCWATKEFEKALKFIDIADEETKKLLRKKIEENNKSIEQSFSTDIDIEFPHPKNLEYLPYQKAGIQFALEKNNVLIADEMGLGKTIQSIGVINADDSINNVLIICPASLKLNWKTELKKWLIRDLTIDIANTKKFPLTNIVIINYDILFKMRKDIDKRTWDLLIADESHFVKNNKAKRTKALIGNSREKIKKIEAKKNIFLTGTPILNRPIEIFNSLKFLDQKNWNNAWNYYQRYCGAQHNGFGWDFSGATNLEELQRKLRQTVMIRRLKKDVLKDLPAKRRQSIEIENSIALNRIIKQQKQYLEEQGFENLKQFADKVFDGEVDITILSKIRHDLGVAKIQNVIKFSKDMLETVDKIVIFAHHKDVVSALMDEFGKISVKVVGGMTDEEKNKSVEDFQNNSDIKVFVGNIKAAGVGLTLTAASTVIFAELDWVPANLTQAEDRCHRIGQKDMVNVYHIVASGDDSVDLYMSQLIIGKQDIADKALNYENMEVQDIEKEKIKLTIPSEEEKIGIKEPVKEKLPAFTQKEHDSILEAINIISSSCDGARAQDGMGFNKLDTDFGHQLAARDFLTPKQLIAAKKLVKKYSRQIPETLYNEVFNQGSTNEL